MAILATYRLQLRGGVGLAAAARLVPYLRELGVSHLYLSPILRARRGSTHGYDVVDPAQLDPALGSERELRRLADTVHRAGMGLLLDIVPNHLAASLENPYWVDVLTHGRASPFARWFDIDWEEGRGRVVLPVLTDTLGRELERGAFRLHAHRAGLRIEYGGQAFPVATHTLPRALRAAHGADALTAFGRGEAGASRLRRLFTAQHYRLIPWQRAPREINYRRFFTINDLVAVRVEDPAVFNATHATVLRWIAAGFVDGLRVDHVDGLLDPAAYLHRLRRAVDQVAGGRAPLPVYVEKILARQERLPAGWPVHGTTGYDFLAEVEDLFVAPKGVAFIGREYARMTGVRRDFGAVAHWGKRKLLRQHLHADLARLVRLMGGAGAARAPLARALREVIVHLPVYRTYGTMSRRGVTLADRATLREAVRAARAGGRASTAALDRVAAALRRPAFLQRFQQVCVPAAAKGIEDTAFYVHVPLVSRNDVGSEPDAPLTSAATHVHVSMRRRATAWPDAMLAVTTHDTKRTADVRARLDVLSEMPAQWTSAVRRWQAWNRRHRRAVSGRRVPDRNTEYLFYQTLAGAWPAEGLRLDALTERVKQYMLKAAREAKRRTSWVRPDRSFEVALTDFVGAAMDPGESPEFIADVRALVARIAPAGLWNSLARTLVQLTAPGVPDVYQGDEVWNFALVDPDNRRPVDFAALRRVLASVRRRWARAGASGALAEMAARPTDPRLKVCLLWCALQARRRDAELFRGGAYIPLRADGEAAEHVFAYARRLAQRWAVCAVTRLPVTLTGDPGRAPVGAVWGDTRLQLPAGWGGRRCTDVLGMRTVMAAGVRGGYLPMAELFAQVPVALLVGRVSGGRGVSASPRPRRLL